MVLFAAYFCRATSRKCCARLYSGLRKMCSNGVGTWSSNGCAGQLNLGRRTFVASFLSHPSFGVRAVSGGEARDSSPEGKESPNPLLLSRIRECGARDDMFIINVLTLLLLSNR